MSAEPPPESPTGARAKGTSEPASSPAAATTNEPAQTEEQLSSPTPLTLRLLGVVFLFTFLPWVGAKLACNDREAPVRAPLDLPTEVLAKQPKSAGLELQQRAAAHRYKEAAELAQGDALRDLLAADELCQKEPQRCESRRAQADRVLTRAVLVRRGSSDAEVRAQSQIGEEVERVTMRLHAEGGRWYVTRRAPFAGELTEPPPAPDATDVSFPVDAHAQGLSPHGVVPRALEPSGSVSPAH